MNLKINILLFLFSQIIQARNRFIEPQNLLADRLNILKIIFQVIKN